MRRIVEEFGTSRTPGEVDEGIRRSFARLPRSMRCKGTPLQSPADVRT